MIRLSRLADYAVMLMSQMAREPSAVVNVQNLVEASGLSAATVSKLLATLARHGLLGSIRGRKGGYRLARSPANISMEQIIAAVDGPIALTVCVDQGIDSCSVSAFCTSRGYWHRINEAIKEALDQVSLAASGLTRQVATPALAYAEAFWQSGRPPLRTEQRDHHQ